MELEGNEARAPERKTISGFVLWWKWFVKQLRRHEVLTLNILSMERGEMYAKRQCAR